MLVSSDLSLVAGTSATAYVVGSAGERIRFVVLEDAASGPAAGPATGLGGLTRGDRPWLPRTAGRVARRRCGWTAVLARVPAPRPCARLTGRATDHGAVTHAHEGGSRVPAAGWAWP